MPMRRLLLALISSLTMATTVPAGPLLDTPIVGGTLLVASHGNIYTTFRGSDADYFSTLFFESPESGESIKLFDSDTSTDVDPIDLGYFMSGTALSFRLHVDDTNEDFYTGGGSNNNDGLPHAQAVTLLNHDEVFITTVGFEDQLGGGDEDYNDLVFNLVNVLDPPADVPEPPIQFLLACGLLGLILVSRRRA